MSNTKEWHKCVCVWPWVGICTLNYNLRSCIRFHIRTFTFTFSLSLSHFHCHCSGPSVCVCGLGLECVHWISTWETAFAFTFTLSLSHFHFHTFTVGQVCVCGLGLYLEFQLEKLPLPSLKIHHNTKYKIQNTIDKNTKYKWIPWISTWEAAFAIPCFH